ncbi:MAG: serine/threonine-protein kinase, partial [Bryobacteraceae bacterium]
MRTPERFRHFRIERLLGEGGMGLVYAAEDERLNRPVALKLMRDVGSSEEARKRFWREARAAAAVNHPNICQIYEIGEEDGELFLVMELLEGEPLAKILERGAMPARDALETAGAVLAALEVLHRRDLVHRDLKPSNIFQTPHGIKLLDFGLARPLPGAEGAETATNLTMPGTMAGTPRYMSPEQVRGEDASTRSDLFAAGIVLFEMLSGKPAFSGHSLAEIFHSVVFEQPAPLEGSGIVAAADRVIRRALAKKPEDRYPSAEAMAAELRAALRGESESTAP